MRAFFFFGALVLGCATTPTPKVAQPGSGPRAAVDHTAPSTNPSASDGEPRAALSPEGEAQTQPPPLAKPLPSPCWKETDPTTREMCLLSSLGLESLNGIAPGTKAQEVLDWLGPPESKGALFSRTEEDGLFQEWRYPSRGIWLELSLKSAKHPVSVVWVRVSAPCDYRTVRGLRVGDSVEEVMRHYAPLIEPGSDETKNLYAGGVLFGFLFVVENNTLTQISLGPKPGTSILDVVGVPPYPAPSAK